MNATLYTTHCPVCEMLEKALKEHDIPFVIEEDVSSLLEKGFKSVPVLKVGEEYMKAKEAFQWINQYK